MFPLLVLLGLGGGVWLFGRKRGKGGVSDVVLPGCLYNENILTEWANANGVQITVHDSDGSVHTVGGLTAASAGNTLHWFPPGKILYVGAGEDWFPDYVATDSYCRFSLTRV